MACLESIYVRHVKGIEECNIKCHFFPNKPNFLVASNGSGKSSCAVAFSSLNNARLKINENDFHCGKEWGDSLLQIGFDDGTVLRANCEKNEIWKEVDSFVINSKLYANLQNVYTGSNVVGRTKLSIRECVLYDKIPEKPNLGYKVTEQRESFEAPVRKLIENLAPLFDDSSFLSDLLKLPSAFKGFGGSRNLEIRRKFLNEFADARKTKEQMLNSGFDCSRIQGVKVVGDICGCMKKNSNWIDNEIALTVNALQLCDFLKGKKLLLGRQLEYLEYQEVRRFAKNLLHAVDRTRGAISPHVKSGSLVVDFPDWSDASNGEIDVLQFCASLIQARLKLGRKDRAILIIDEVFDYLDDANLIVAQYFLKKMMDDFREEGKSLYAIILTHIDPVYFKSYRFKDFHRSYIDAEEHGNVSSYMEKLLTDRDRCRREEGGIYQEISSCLLHYSAGKGLSSGAVAYLKKKGIPDPLCSGSEAFARDMVDNLHSYLANDDYDMTKACCGIRIIVEEYAYLGLREDSDKADYLKLNKGTEQRLAFAEERGSYVPEVMHLLGGIYNSCLHLTGEPGELSPIARQLNNKVITKMVKDVVDFYNQLKNG